MATLEGQVVPARFADNFVSTDQDIADLSKPKPETRWCLLELPKEQLQALEGGASFYFQAQDGAADESGAALSTENATFGLEFLENSNSLFIAQLELATAAPAQAAPKPPAEGGAAEAAFAPAEGGAASTEGAAAAPAPAAPPAQSTKCEVFAQCRGQLIVKPVQVNVQRMRELLAKQALPAEQAVDADGKPIPPLTLEALGYQVAASPAELKVLLDQGPYVEVDGVWRLLPTALERDIVDSAVTLVAARGWQMDDVDGEALLAEVQQHLGKAVAPTLAVLRKALRSVEADPKPKLPLMQDAQGDSTADVAATPQQAAAATSPAKGGGAGVAEEGSRIRLDVQKVARFQALQLLRQPPARVRERFQLPPPGPRPKRARVGGATSTGGGMLQVSELAAVLQELLGSAEPLPQDRVMAILGDRAYVDELEGTVHALDPTTLPPDPVARLARLLDLQSHWKGDRLAALIAPCLGAGQKVDTWLIKNTRAVHIEVEPGKEERLLVKKFGL